MSLPTETRFQAAKLQKASVIVLEPVPYMGQLLRSLLQDLGVGQVLRVSDANMALAALASGGVHAIFCDERVGPEGAAGFCQLLRRSPVSPDPYVPVIVTGFQPSRARVEKLRDLGATEYLVKPVSGRQLADKLTAVLTRPRPFVRSHAYIGPDRRRQAASGGPDFEERRTARPMQRRRVSRPHGLPGPEELRV